VKPLVGKRVLPRVGDDRPVIVYELLFVQIVDRDDSLS
jgi:hypothetical protein